MLALIRTGLTTTVFVMISIAGKTQTLANVDIDLSKTTNGIDVPVSMDLAKLKIIPAADLIGGSKE